MPKPVTAAARKPASDLRGANGSHLMPGKWGGRGGVYLPQRRPIVEAVVSDHERLIDTTATSRGYSASTKMTPTRYHTVPLILSRSDSRMRKPTVASHASANAGMLRRSASLALMKASRAVSTLIKGPSVGGSRYLR
ncbi:uncharacterized protein LOC62_02G003272 [Vanrija pseudolonga]|uniref:Uncharacterized protein n=1 Tax=Vanrija pseudolonga TaxID=143232 RepID=A0AAF0Y8N2_9TREE|nr:hypothetical protein LOC62_02G003272 [Vanrija pseudolonga]